MERARPATGLTQVCQHPQRALQVRPTTPALAPPVPPRMSLRELRGLMDDVLHLSTTVDVFANALEDMNPAQISELIRAASHLAQGIHLLSMQRQHWAGSPATLALIDEALDEGRAMLARVSSS